MTGLVYFTACKKDNSNNNDGPSTGFNAPTGVTASLSGTSIVVQWDLVSEATYYEVYRSSSPDGSYSQVGSSTTNNQITDNSPLNGDNYYKVKAFNDDEESEYSNYTHCYFTGGGGGNTPNPPTGVTASVSGTTVIVSWNSVDDATSYKVFRSSSASGSYSQLSSSNNTSYTDNSPLSGNNYYKVKAVNSDGDSDFSDYASCNYTGGGGGGGTKPNPPTGLTASVSGTSINLTWNTVQNATSYVIYRNSSSSGTYSSIGTSPSTSFTDTNPLNGWNYYKVASVNSAGEGNQSSSISCNFVKTYKPVVATFTGTKSGNGVKLTWTFSTQATTSPPTSIKIQHQVWNGTDWSVLKQILETVPQTSSGNVLTLDYSTGPQIVNRYVITGTNSAGDGTGTTTVNGF